MGAEEQAMFGLSPSAQAKLAHIAEEAKLEELARKKRQRARWSRRQSELRWVKDRHPGLRVEAEQPKIHLPADVLRRWITADYAVFDECENLKAIYEFGSLSCPNKFQFLTRLESGD